MRKLLARTPTILQDTLTDTMLQIRPDIQALGERGFVADRRYQDLLLFKNSLAIGTIRSRIAAR